MAVLITDISALELWDKGLSSRVRLAGEHELAGLSTDAEERRLIVARNYGVSAPMQLLSLDGFHGKAKEWDYHVWNQPLPPGSVVRANDEIYVATPEFCFMRMVPALGFYDSLKLGMEICGAYSTLVPEGRNARKRPPLTNTERLCAYLNRVFPATGESKAQRVAKLLVDGSASPGETASYAQLCLPYRYGWYGFRKPMLNQRINLTAREQRTLGKGYLKADLLWECDNRFVACEYKGVESHSGEFNLQKDSIREVVMGNEKVAVVTITHAMLMEPSQMHAVAELLAKLLGRRLRIPGQRFWETQREARAELMRSGVCSWVR